MATDSADAGTVALPEILSVQKLAAYLGVPVSTLYLWRTQGKGPLGFRAGKRVYYRAADVATWLEEQAAAR